LFKAEFKGGNTAINKDLVYNSHILPEQIHCKKNDFIAKGLSTRSIVRRLYDMRDRVQKIFDAHKIKDGNNLPIE